MQLSHHAHPGRDLVFRGGLDVHDARWRAVGFDQHRALVRLGRVLERVDFLPGPDVVGADQGVVEFGRRSGCCVLIHGLVACFGLGRGFYLSPLQTSLLLSSGFMEVDVMVAGEVLPQYWARRNFIDEFYADREIRGGL